MIIIGVLSRPSCPRCGGNVCRDYPDEEVYCLVCGWRPRQECEAGEKMSQPARSRGPFRVARGRQQKL